MDERAINGAAIEAIRDLDIDCEIKEVCQSGDDWCVQFSGKYGQFCDSFKNQFGKESSPRVIREKIKSHLIKVVNKIRSGTGRKRKPMASERGDSPEQESGILAAPLKMIGEVFDRVAGIAGIVINQASTVAESARDVVTDAASNLSPVTIEVRSTTPEIKERIPARPAPKKPVKARKAATAKAKKATKRVASKQAEKAIKASGRTKKAARKTAKKSLKRAK